MPSKKAFPVPVKVSYSCEKCPAFCCTYEQIEVTKKDIERLARHFGIDYKQAEFRFTKLTRDKTARQLRHRPDTVFKSACVNLDQETRRCTAYEARPKVCRQFPDKKRCGYYDFLTFERKQQGDKTWVALAEGPA